MRAPSAVLLLATTVFAQAEAGLRERVDQALERARPVLVHNLEKTHGDALGLVCLAARHLGMDESDESYAEALKRLAALRTQNTYGLALRCMVAAGGHHVRCPGPPPGAHNLRGGGERGEGAMGITHDSIGGEV